jgi:hypothetical protein
MHRPDEAMRRLAAIAAVLSVVAISAAARASERLAVVLVVEGDSAMADGLTEIVIARLAEQRGNLIGLRELRGRMHSPTGGETVDDCLAAGRCLSELGEVSGAQRAVIGRMTRAKDGAWRLDLGLADTRAGTVTRRPPRDLPADTEGIVAGIRAAIDDLPPPEEPAKAAPAPAAAAPPPAVPAGTDLNLRSEPERSKPTGKHAIVGWTLAGLAGASFVTAAVLRYDAGLMPTGATRAETQADLEGKKTEARVATGLAIAGGVLAAVSVGVFVWRW